MQGTSHLNKNARLVDPKELRCPGRHVTSSFRARRGCRGTCFHLFVFPCGCSCRLRRRGASSSKERGGGDGEGVRHPPPPAAFAWGRPLSSHRHRAEGTEHPPGRTPASRPCAPDLSRAQGSCALSTACGLSSRACSGCCLPRGAFLRAGAGPHSCLTGASLLGAPGVPRHCIRVSRVSFPSGRGEEGGEERGDNSVGPVPALSN